MRQTVEMEPRGRVLWVRSPPIVEPDSMIMCDPEVRSRIEAECEANGCTGILVDARGVEMRIEWPDKARAALAMAKLQAPGRRVAGLADPGTITTDGDFQKVAGLAGAVVCVFTDEEKALEWLARAGDDQPDRPRAPAPLDRAPEGQVQRTGEG